MTARESSLSERQPPAVLPEIMARRSGAAFDSRPVEREKIDSLIEATRWAPSARNLQPWYVIFVQGEENHGAVLDALSDFNKGWAPPAPLQVVFGGRPEDDARREPGLDYYLFDIGLACQNFMLQAERLGLVTHLMAAYDQEAMREAVGAPEGYRIVCVIAVGYPGDPESLPRDVYEHWELRERVRRPVAEDFFKARWGTAWE